MSPKETPHERKIRSSLGGFPIDSSSILQVRFWSINTPPQKLIWNKKTGGLEDDFPFETGDFQVPAVSFWERKLIFCRISFPTRRAAQQFAMPHYRSAICQWKGLPTSRGNKAIHLWLECQSAQASCAVRNDESVTVDHLGLYEN